MRGKKAKELRRLARFVLVKQLRTQVEGGDRAKESDLLAGVPHAIYMKNKDNNGSTILNPYCLKYMYNQMKYRYGN